MRCTSHMYFTRMVISYFAAWAVVNVTSAKTSKLELKLTEEHIKF